MPLMYSPAQIHIDTQDALVTAALTRLLSLDKQLAVTPTPTGADCVLNDEVVLETLRDVPLGQVLELIKDLAARSRGQIGRHLRVISAESPAASSPMLKVLSDRELEVVRLVAEGLSNKEISARLSLSDKTVKNHISHILAKLNLSARTQVAVHALRAGIV